ncbi:MAG: FAD-binding protein [Desulfobacterota bacterium]|nr:FAD-binding protein [Thermodesulfobacteriota bacterium]
MKKIQCDVLIIGAGGAGLRAALEAKETLKRGRIVLATKGRLGKSGVTATACSDRMAFHATLPYTEPVGPENWRYHAEDIYRMGGYVSDGDLALILARESRSAFEYLDRLGVPFVRREDGRVDQFVTDGSDYARACYTGPRTANHIEEALVRKISTTDIRIIERCMIAELLQYRGRVIGAVGIDEEIKGERLEDRIWIISSKATVLATGGAGEVFQIHVYPDGMTGDGYGLAYRAGAELVNMEFIQIGPASLKTRLNCSGSLMRAVPRFVNERGEEFLWKYLPGSMDRPSLHNLIFEKGSSWPLSLEKPTHIIDVAMFKEREKGHCIFLDYRTNPEGFSFGNLDPKWQERYRREVKRPLSDLARDRSPFDRLLEINPESIDWLREHGVDLGSGELLEIGPCVQHFQGGVKIREKAQTSLKGLFAAGECAGGQHGANRPGGNALLDGQVFGKIAGREASLEALRQTRPPIHPAQIDRLLREWRGLDRGEKASEVRKEIQSIASRYASVVRTEAGLREGLRSLRSLRQMGIKRDERGWVFALETRNLLDVAEIILRACLLRRESRGPHLFFRCFEDLNPLPSRDPEGRRYIILQKQSGKMGWRRAKPVDLRFPPEE